MHKPIKESKDSTKKKMNEIQGRIIVVGDNRMNRLKLSRGLENQGHRVWLAKNGLQALELLKEQVFDLILLDILMPKINGYQLLRKLKIDPRLREIPVIVISAIGEMSSIIRCIEMGAEDYLPKPFNRILLNARIGAVFEKKQLLDKERLYTKSMESELEIGHQIQSSFFPESLPRISGWEIATYYQTALKVSGAFYDAFQLGQNGRLGLVVADTCNKGVGAALTMAVFRSLIRIFSKARQFIDNSEELLIGIVSSINTYITTIHNRSKMHAMVFFCVLETKKNTLYYVNAGHKQPLVLSANGEVKKILEPTAPVIGHNQDLPITVDKVELKKNDTLIAYTQGVVDALNRNKVSLSGKTLMSHLKKPYPSALSLLKHIENKIDGQASAADKADGIIMLALRHKQSVENEKHEIKRLTALENISAFRGFIEQACFQMGLDEDITFDFKLVVDEACTNIITHGYRKADPGLITITFEKDKENAKLTIHDKGVSFKPENASEPDVESDWEKRQPGGLGLFIIKNMMDEVNYESKDKTGNYLLLTKYLH